ncbi:MAG: hypothetical protein JWP13_447 [Candidatus Saccharibacteria bacterium]|nr:hypothetical protein [Candidatus Saccharibacteria bacterium]
MSGLYVATIKPGWANEVGSRVSTISDYNQKETQNVQRQVSLPLLGGLALHRFSVEYGLIDTARAKEYGPVVDLAFGDASRHVRTQWLIEAALSQDRPELAEQLERRLAMVPAGLNEEKWAFPIEGLDVTRPQP